MFCRPTHPNVGMMISTPGTFWAIYIVEDKRNKYPFFLLSSLNSYEILRSDSRTKTYQGMSRFGIGRPLDLGRIVFTTNATNSDVSTAPKWAYLVSEIVAGGATAFTDLYQQLRGLRYYFQRQAGFRDADDLYHQTVVDLFVQIRRGELRDPERLAGYARTMAQRKIAALINDRALGRTRERSIEDRPLRDIAPNPESAAIKHQQEQIAARILNSLPSRHREVLVRFYLDGHSAEQIQADLNLTATQFRLIKSRAKARFAVLCQARLVQKRGPGRADSTPVKQTA